MADDAFSPQTLKARIQPWLQDATSWERLIELAQLVEQSPVNVTAWSGRELWEKGILASLLALDQQDRWTNGVDIGSGGGFPGLVLAAVRPDCPMTLVESRVKRAQFLERAVGALSLSRVSVIAERAEVLFQSELRETFDLATIRAVGNLRLSLELIVPALRPGGAGLIWRGRLAPTEALEGEEWCSELGGRWGDAVSLRLPSGRYGVILALQKLSPAPVQYPRSGSKLGR